MLKNEKKDNQSSLFCGKENYEKDTEETVILLSEPPE